MRCNMWKRRISDLLDGRLSEKNKNALDRHLTRCLSCRTYLAHLEKIRQEAAEIERTKITPQYREEFSTRLKKQLQGISDERKKRIPANWRWIYGTAAASLAVGLILVLLVFKPGTVTRNEIYGFSVGGSLSEIYSDISTSSELEELFNSLILASIDETLAEMGWTEEIFILNNPLDNSSISERELDRLESSIKKNVNL